MAFFTGPIPIQPPTRSAEDNTSVRVVALGGGHGLSASLSALRRLTTDLTAVVTVADDGGSSGRLREELDVLPPGDLRMALAALCDDTDWGRTWRDVMQHRFTSKPGSVGLAGPARGGQPADRRRSGNCSRIPWPACAGPARCSAPAARCCR